MKKQFAAAAILAAMSFSAFAESAPEPGFPRVAINLKPSQCQANDVPCLASEVTESVDAACKKDGGEFDRSTVTCNLENGNYYTVGISHTSGRLDNITQGNKSILVTYF